MLAQIRNVIPLFMADTIQQESFTYIGIDPAGRSNSSWSKRLLDVLKIFQRNMGCSKLKMKERVIGTNNLTRIEIAHFQGNHLLCEASGVVIKSFPLFRVSSKKTYVKSRAYNILSELYFELGCNSKYYPSNVMIPVLSQCTNKLKVKCLFINVINASFILGLVGRYIGFDPEKCYVLARMNQHFGKVFSDTFTQEMLNEELIPDMEEIIDLIWKTQEFRETYRTKSALLSWRNLNYISLYWDIPYHLLGLKYERFYKEMVDICLGNTTIKHKKTILVDGLSKHRTDSDFTAHIDGYKHTDPSKQDNYYGEHIHTNYLNKEIYNNNSLRCMKRYTMFMKTIKNIMHNIYTYL